ncbi:hypothetical protein [Streptomyces fildesensis]|uniref:hypothetical protein n=1 Tax=Streptomyces fildesensis TaxID=375757 RepID=UPI0018DF29C7|nr:hypothetical protein [Streptomyces fildesensis]
MAGYRTGASSSDKGVYVGLARHAVEELIASLRCELATLEAVRAMMCQDAESADAPEEQPTGDEDMSTTPLSRGAASEDSAADEDLPADEARPDPDPRTLGPPRNGSMRDAILTLLCAAQEAMSITDIAAAVRPGADATVRSSVGKTLNRMKQLGEVENVAPGMYRAVLASRAA